MFCPRWDKISQWVPRSNGTLRFVVVVVDVVVVDVVVVDVVVVDVVVVVVVISH